MFLLQAANGVSSQNLRILDDLAPRIKELRIQQKDLEKKQNDLLDASNHEGQRELSLEKVHEYASSLRDLLNSSSFVEQKSFPRPFVKRIDFNEPRVVIHYGMTVPGELTGSEEVLRLDRPGSPTRIRT
jgi:hypothetical protein